MKLFNLKPVFQFFFMGTFCLFIAASCSSDNQFEIENNDELLIEKGILLPTVISDKGEEYVESYMSDISESLELTYLNNYTVAQYLQHFQKEDMIFNSISESENLSEIDLSEYLSSDQLKIIESNLTHSLSEIQTRGCTKIYAWNNCCWRNQWNQCVGCWKHVGWHC